MPVSVRWENDAHDLIRFDFVGRWTWEETHKALDQNLALLDSVDYVVDFIVDMLQSDGLPSGVLQQLKRVAELNHPNSGLTIYVGVNPLLNALGAAFRRTYPRTAVIYAFDFAKTIEEAHAKIARWRAEKNKV